MNKLVRDVMTRNPFCCNVFDNVTSVAAAMNDYRLFVVPVTEKGKKSHLLGIVTPWNLCMKVIATGRDARNVEVGECLAGQLAFCEETDSVPDVIEKLTAASLPGMPVVNAAFDVIGTISIGDLLEHDAIAARELHDWSKALFSCGQIGTAVDTAA